MTYLNYGEGVTAHGEEFKCICEKFNWPKEISKASLDLKNLIPTNNGKDLKVRKQIKKLFELAKSSNLHEAQEATRKANELLAKYNLENALEFSEEENVYVKDVLIYKKNNKKLHAIYEILTYFNVSPFFSKGQGECKLGVLGDLLSVESADYIANFLDHEFERLWKINKKNNSNLKGSVMKNSFFTGLSFGFCEKLKAQKYQYQIHGYNLVQIDKRLEQMRRIAFPRLGHTSSSAQVNNQSRNLGIESGRNLNIRHGLNMNQTLFLPGEKN
ncbi:MAG: DUF2786 domain-containing protein [Halobacteriovoraceae bacterium]|nr:DUF2786 domain-containing protein [Halobacteriovoraceae bacterium]